MNWPVTTLGKVARWGSGGTPKRSEARYFGAGVPWLSISDLNDGEVTDAKESLTQLGLENSSAKVVPPGTLLVAMYGSIGKLGIAGRELCTSQAIASAQPDPLVIDTRYLFHFLLAERTKLQRLGRGGTQMNIGQTDLKSWPIPLPPLGEQRRIGQVLDQADALRSKRQAATALLGTVTQSIFSTCFGDPESNPNGWEVVPLAGVVRAGTLVTYGIVQAGDEYEDGVPYIRTGDIVNGEIVTSQLRRTAPEIAARFARSRVDVGDIVMSIRATVGTTALVPSSIDGANLTQGTARIAPSERALGQYLLHMLRTPGIQNWIQRQVKGATFREITLTRLRELPVILPPVAEQKAFGIRCDAVQHLKRTHSSSLVQSNTLFASLQHRAFRGEL